MSYPFGGFHNSGYLQSSSISIDGIFPEINHPAIKGATIFRAGNPHFFWELTFRTFEGPFHCKSVPVRRCPWARLDDVGWPWGPEWCGNARMGTPGPFGASKTLGIPGHHWIHWNFICYFLGCVDALALEVRWLGKKIAYFQGQTVILPEAASNQSIV